MSDWVKKMLDFNEGFYNMPQNKLPGAHVNLDRRFGNMMGGHDQGGTPPEQSGGRGFWSGITALAGIAGGILGLLLIANLTDPDHFLLGLLILAIGAVAGAFIAAMPFILLRMAVDNFFEKRLWAKQGRTNTADLLVQYWTGRFGNSPDPVFMQAIDENGAAWVMDRKGNFIVRLSNGKRLFIGQDPDEKSSRLIVQMRGKRGFDIEDAFAQVLAHRSMGNTTINLTGGSKNYARLMWVAGKLLDVEVSDYSPDAGALTMLNELRA